MVVTFNEVTDLKDLADALRCSEETVRQSERRYRELVQNANSAIIRWNCDGTVTFFNEYAQSFFGYSETQAIGKHVSMLLPPQDSAGGDLTTLAADIVASPDKYVNNVNENVCRDGRRVWMAWTNRPIRDAAGNVSEILAIGMDITDRKAVEQRVQVELQRFYAVLSRMYSAVLLVTDQGQVEFANPAFCRLYGLKDSPSEMVGLSSEQMLAKIRHCYVDPPRALARIAEIVERGEPVKGEELLLTNGCACLRDFVPVKLGGVSYGRMWLHADISERKAVEDALRESEARFTSVFRSSPAALCITKAQDGTFVDVNEAYERLVGYSRPELVGRKTTDVAVYSNPRDRDQVITLLEQNGKFRNMEFALRHKDGRRIDAIASLEVVTIKGQRFYLSSLLDITERKAAEEALRQSKAKLDFGHAVGRHGGVGT